MDLPRGEPQRDPPPNNVVPHGGATSTICSSRGTFEFGEVLAPVSPPYGLDLLFLEEDPTSYVNKLVGGKSPRMGKAKIVDQLKNPWTIEGLKVTVLKDLMSEAIANLQLSLVVDQPIEYEMLMPFVKIAKHYGHPIDTYNRQANAPNKMALGKQKKILTFALGKENTNPNIQSKEQRNQKEGVEEKDLDGKQKEGKAETSKEVTPNVETAGSIIPKNKGTEQLNQTEKRQDMKEIERKQNNEKTTGSMAVPSSNNIAPHKVQELEDKGVETTNNKKQKRTSRQVKRRMQKLKRKKGSRSSNQWRPNGFPLAFFQDFSYFYYFDSTSQPN
ncbi:hypothetical protein SUGI_0019070 [Cryptomeria japonica]|nr:hypothetical protein SUGI_0019070 [Cryptomeria japonica]